MLVDGVPVSASLFDFGLFLFHNGAETLRRGSGPYLYLAKLESHHEARLWNEVFIHGQVALGIPRGSIRATVLIETILAAFEMDEILYELREHAAGLNAGRWDYLFSGIKKLRSWPELAVPDRSQLTMTVPFMRAYTELLVRTCHRRGAHAIGGMAAFIPNRRDPAVTEVALAKVRDDKERESGDGFDGTWVAHPDLVPVAMEVFDRVLGDRPNQKERMREDVVGQRGRAARPARARRRGHRGRDPGQHPGRAGVPRLVAARRRRGRHRQPDGGRRDRRDLALAALALADARRRPGRRARLRRGRCYASIRDEELARLGGAGRAACREAAGLSRSASSSTTTSPEFLTPAGVSRCSSRCAGPGPHLRPTRSPRRAVALALDEGPGAAAADEAPSRMTGRPRTKTPRTAPEISRPSYGV